MRSYTIPTIQNTGIDELDTQHTYICIYLYEVIGHVQTPKHSNFMLLLMICFEFLRTNFLKKHVPESTPGGRQPHWNQRWPCGMWRCDSELVQSATPPKTNMLNPKNGGLIQMIFLCEAGDFQVTCSFSGVYI